MKTAFAASTTRGTVRGENQDNFYFNGKIRALDSREFSVAGRSAKDRQLYAVCDGMGGEEQGEMASLLAVQKLQACSQGNIFEEPEKVVRELNQEVCRYAQEQGIQTGTTLALIAIKGNAAVAVNIGDSRIYLIRRGKIDQLSVDHTEFQMMLDAGILQAKDRLVSCAGNRLLQFLGLPESEMQLEPTVKWLKLQPGDRFLICSDGVQGGLTDDQIAAVLGGESDQMNRCKKLLAEAQALGSKDNITALVIDILK